MTEKQNGRQPQFVPHAFAQAAQCKHIVYHNYDDQCKNIKQIIEAINELHMTEKELDSNALQLAHFKQCK